MSYCALDEDGARSLLRLCSWIVGIKGAHHRSGFLVHAPCSGLMLQTPCCGILLLRTRSADFCFCALFDAGC